MSKCTRCKQEIDLKELCLSPRNNAPYHIPCFKEAEAERELAAYVLETLKIKRYTPKMMEQRTQLHNEGLSDVTILQTLKYMKAHNLPFRDLSPVLSYYIIATSYFNAREDEVDKRNALFLQNIRNAQSPQKLAQARKYRQLAAGRAWVEANK